MSKNSDKWSNLLGDFIEELIKSQDEIVSSKIINTIRKKFRDIGNPLGITLNTPYINTIPEDKQVDFPGKLKVENVIKSIIRWNAMAMVVKANIENDGIGGHISTYASSATLYEIAFNHFFKGGDGKESSDIIFFQGHASPGIYARAYLEGRLSVDQLHNFRQDLSEKGGITSYPHPLIMPDFWQFPTVSMGLGPIMSIYQAKFNRYLVNRGIIKEEDEPRVWCFVGDGEMDEPESSGALSLAGREHLDKLLWVVNCNLQRLDGPVRGNHKIIQEFEALFRGAGWNVIKLIWGSDWDDLLAKDEDGFLKKRMEEAVDGDYQKYSVEHGSYTRKHFFGKYPKLLEMVSHLSDDQIQRLLRGGHDSKKVYSAYKLAIETKGQPSVILAKTVKGYGLGEAGEGRNITHQQKKLNERELRSFKKRFNIPISDEAVVNAPFYRPSENSEVVKYIKSHRKKLGGSLPCRKVISEDLEIPEESLYESFYSGSGDNEVSTTMATVRILSDLLKYKDFGKRVVPIIPDEARTFGMDALFRQFGIFSSKGQLYEPVDSENFLYYREAKDGQILEEGITEAGSMASFISAGTAYSTHHKNLIPCFMLYSMFGFQRVADLIWAACDSRAKGFIFGATAGRTTLNGEGLQHQDGHSHLIASTMPKLQAYDPAFAYEIAVIIQDGIKKMIKDNQDLIYYITVYNENYMMPKMPDIKNIDVKDGIIKGLYKFNESNKKCKHRVNILSSGGIFMQAIEAQKILEKDFDVATDIWSITSYKNLRTDALNIDRINRLNPGKKEKKNFIQESFQKHSNTDITVAVSDNMKMIPDMLSRWIPGYYTSLGTDGFGLSDTRENLRDYFEIDAKHISYSVLHSLYKQDKIDLTYLKKCAKKLGINSNKKYPLL